MHGVAEVKTRHSSVWPLCLVLAADLILLLPIYGDRALVQESTSAVLRIFVVTLLAGCGIMIPIWPFRVISLAMLGLVVFAGAFSIGMFYAPAFITAGLVVAAQKDGQSERDDSQGPAKGVIYTASELEEFRRRGQAPRR